MIKAYRDTWRVGIHSSLTYLRDRIKLAREMLIAGGSLFVQISNENVHHVREVLDEIFGPTNFVSLITFRKTSGAGSPSGGTTTLAATTDFLVWYARDKAVVKYRQLFNSREYGGEGAGQYTWGEWPDGTRRRLTPGEEESPPTDARILRPGPLTSQSSGPTTQFPFDLDGQTYVPGKGGWKTNAAGMERLRKANRLIGVGKTLCYVRYLDDFPAFPLNDVWDDTRTSGFADPKKYVVQTNAKVIARCLLMTTEPGDLVLDPTCGSGTTAYVAEQQGRRWITCDSSRVALSIARQRLLTASFPYYQLAYPEAGVSGDFQYEVVSHVTLKSIARDTRLDEAVTPQQVEAVLREEAEQETLYDRPQIDRGKVRVSGPFTVEAIPVPVMAAVEDSMIEAYPERSDGEGRLDMSAADYIDTLIGLLQKDGVTFPGGKKLSLANLRPVAHGGALHAEADVEDEGRAVRVAISFGPQYGPVTQQQVEQAARSARLYDLLIFAGFAFDSAAQAFIQENPDPNLRMELAHIRPDVQLEDLLKVTANSQLFSVFGQPDIKPKKHRDSTYTVELRGVDVYDPTTGEVHSSDGANVAAWFLDQDYDGRTFGICQAFFPGDKDAWSKLQKALRGTIDEERFEAMRGTVSLPFPAGEYRTIAVKVIDFRGNEVIRIMRLDDVR